MLTGKLQPATVENVRLADRKDPETRNLLRHSHQFAEETRDGRVSLLIHFQQCGGGRRLIRKRLAH